MQHLLCHCIPLSIKTPDLYLLLFSNEVQLLNEIVLSVKWNGMLVSVPWDDTLTGEGGLLGWSFFFKVNECVKVNTLNNSTVLLRGLQLISLGDN